MKPLNRFDAEDLGLTGRVLVAAPAVQPGWEVVVTDVLDWHAERRWDGEQIVAFTYRAPGCVTPITALAPLRDLTTQPGPAPATHDLKAGAPC